MPAALNFTLAAIWRQRSSRPQAPVKYAKNRLFTLAAYWKAAGEHMRDM